MGVWEYGSKMRDIDLLQIKNHPAGWGMVFNYFL